MVAFIFESCHTLFIDLVLSGRQPIMNGDNYSGYNSDLEREPYEGSSEHNKCQFLGNTFNSITCGNTKFPEDS